MKLITTPTVHPFKPGAGWMRDLIRPVDPRPDYRTIPWKSVYQGEIDYEYRGQRLRFRYGKISWKAGYWNFKDEREFEVQHNGNWGMLTRGCEPVDAETLRIFRNEEYPSATTGFYDHLAHCWVECEPTKEEPSMGTWLRFKLTAEYRKEVAA